MNDITLTGLAKQLVIAQLLDETVAQQAQQQAQRNKLSLVSYLVQNKLVKSRDLATLTADQFGSLSLTCRVSIRMRSLET